VGIRLVLPQVIPIWSEKQKQKNQKNKKREFLNIDIYQKF
jgi:hypothetical protein